MDAADSHNVWVGDQVAGAGVGTEDAAGADGRVQRGDLHGGRTHGVSSIDGRRMRSVRRNRPQPLRPARACVGAAAPPLTAVSYHALSGVAFRSRRDIASLPFSSTPPPVSFLSLPLACWRQFVWAEEAQSLDWAQSLDRVRGLASLTCFVYSLSLVASPCNSTRIHLRRTQCPNCVLSSRESSA